MIKLPRGLSDAECFQVVRLYEQMLACRNHQHGETLANKIDEIIEHANQANYDKIAKLIHQQNLPMMMKLPRITQDRRLYLIDRSQIGSYSYSPKRLGHDGHGQQQPKRQITNGVEAEA